MALIFLDGRKTGRSQRAKFREELSPGPRDRDTGGRLNCVSCPAPNLYAGPEALGRQDALNYPGNALRRFGGFLAASRAFGPAVDALESDGFSG